MKLSEYAKKHEITYRTAWNRWKAGKLNGFVDETGHVVLEKKNPSKEEYLVIYCRVSSSENKSNLDSQAERLTSYCLANGWKVHEVIKEIGSGLNENRKKLNKLLSEGLPTKIVAEHKDRLTRFGFTYIKECCDKFGCEIEIVNPSKNDKEDLIQDFISVITSFCARIYGQRRNKRRTEKLIKELENDSKL